jgi:mycothiol synthase
MSITLPIPPKLRGHIWRSLHRADAAALYQLEADCARTDGHTSPGTIVGHDKRFDDDTSNVATDTLCAVNATGQLAAAAWVSWDDRLKHEYRAFLEGNVHPDYRGCGVGSFILSWMEARASQIFASLAEDRPCVLRIDFYDQSDDAVALFEKHGFQFVFAEDEMRRDLGQPIPAIPLPEGMAFVTSTPQRAGLFFNVYEHAFRERPGFPGWTEDIWCHNLTSDSDFRADLSLLIMDGSEALGFAVCHVETEGQNQLSSEGWIVQMGVRPSRRNRGLGSALLSKVMRKFKSEGLRCAVLDVNVNNP